MGRLTAISRFAAARIGVEPAGCNERLGATFGNDPPILMQVNHHRPGMAHSFQMPSATAAMAHDDGEP